MKENKKTKIILIILMIIFGLGLIYSITNIIIWKLDNDKNKKQINYIKDITVIEEVINNENTEIINQEEKNEFDPYWDYIKMNLIDVDFKKLKDINQDVAGWIKIEGTNVNYPFVQANDNKYYLNHSFDKTYNQSGWIYLDYRNNKNEYDKNTIIYGHSLRTGEMFGTVKNTLKEEWLNNTNNYVIKISTEKENTLWQIFSIYTIPDTTDYLKINFKKEEEFNNFTNMLLNRSKYKFNTTVNENDKILTISTCYINTENKIVIHAKLIKKETK